MARNRFLNNVAYAFVAQGATFALGVLTSLFVPKLLGVAEFGYWQLFILYYGYAGILLFGINDGIYLRIGGREYSTLDYKSLGTQFKIIMAAQCGFFFIISLFIVMFSSDSNREFLYLCVGIYAVLFNASSILGYVFQAVNRTKVFSISLMIHKITYMIFIGFAILTRLDDFKIYIIMFLVSQTVSLIYCVIKGRDIVFSKNVALHKAMQELIINARIGIKLMVGYYAGTLIVGIGRMIIDWKWGIEAFGNFSFSFSLTYFALSFIGQFSMVLFPTLRQVSEDAQRRSYHLIKNGLMIVLPMVYIAYNPLCSALSKWLPQYADSLKYLALILPIFNFDGKMNLLCNTYFKVLRKEKFILLVNIACVAVSTALTLVCVFVLKSISFVALGMAITIALRSIVSELYLSGIMNANIKKALLCEIALAVVFVLSTWYLRNYSTIILLTAYAIHCVINRNEIGVFLGDIKSIRNSQKTGKTIQSKLDPDRQCSPAKSVTAE